MLIYASMLHHVPISCCLQCEVELQLQENKTALDFRCLFGQRPLSSAAAPPNVNSASSRTSF